ncbi:hypothetical protein [Klebsiella phage 05F01]|nr:hypothetical protein [Klebsiella phage 05F01]
MGREYVIQSWVKHDKGDHRIIPDELIDHAPGYSGEQIGNRNAKSNGNTWSRVAPGWLPNGKADLSTAVDVSEESKGNPLVLVDSAYKTLLDYEGKVTALKNALAAHKITKGSYDQALKVLDAKLYNAEKRLEKLLNTIPPDEDKSSYIESEEVLEEDEYPLHYPHGAEKFKSDYFYENCIVTVDVQKESSYDVSHREAIMPINKRDKSLWQILTLFFITMLPTVKD